MVYTGDYIKEIAKKLNKNFNSLCDWLVENKLSIHFGQEKTKSIIFGSKRNLKSKDKLEISRGDIEIKPYSKLTYLGCILYSYISGEHMAPNVL